MYTKKRNCRSSKRWFKSSLIQFLIITNAFNFSCIFMLKIARSTRREIDCEIAGLIMGTWEERRRIDAIVNQLRACDTKNQLSALTWHFPKDTMATWIVFIWPRMFWFCNKTKIFLYRGRTHQNWNHATIGIGAICVRSLCGILRGIIV